MMIEILYKDETYMIYLWKNWARQGKPLQIFFCKGDNRASIYDDGFYVTRSKDLSTCLGIHPLPMEDYDAVSTIIEDNDLISKAINIYIGIYGTCVYK